MLLQRKGSSCPPHRDNYAQEGLPSIMMEQGLTANYWPNGGGQVQPGDPLSFFLASSRPHPRLKLRSLGGVGWTVPAAPTPGSQTGQQGVVGGYRGKLRWLRGGEPLVGHSIHHPCRGGMGLIQDPVGHRWELFTPLHQEAFRHACGRSIAAFLRSIRVPQGGHCPPAPLPNLPP